MVPFATRIRDLAKRGIGRRLAVYILAFSSVVTLLSTALQLSLEYQRDVFDIETRLAQIRVSYANSLANSLWVDSKNDVQLQLDGIFRLPDMQYLEVVAEDKTVYGKVGVNQTEQIISREFPLYFTHRDQQVYLGELIVVANLEGVYQRLMDKVLVILVTQTVKTFLVSLFILFLFQILVGRYLKKISTWSESLHAEQMAQPLELNRKQTIHTIDDELSQVATAINDMQMRLVVSHKELEGRVTDRTQQLVALNETLSQQSERLRALYETTSKAGLSLEDQINAMLRHGCRFLGMEMGRVCHINTSEKTNTFIYVHCEPGLNVKPGTRVKLEDSFCSIAVNNDEPTAISHVAQSEYRASRCYEFSHLEAYIAAQIRIRGEVFGTVNFASRTPRSVPFGARDYDLLKLIGSWIGVTLERQFVQQELSVAKESAEAASVAKSAFLANMSHEIRTPLTAIIGYADMSLQSDQSTQERIHAIETIHRSGTHLLRIINDVLDLSKIEARKFEVDTSRCSLFELMDDVAALTQMKAAEKGLAFVVNYHYPVPTHIETDPVRLKQIMINLCGNAIKFTEQGQVHVNIGYDRVNSLLTMEVSDSGIGLTPDEMSRLFQEFQQADAQIHRKYGGTGLGLALSQHLATLLGGKITAVSKKGEGSTFRLAIAQQVERDGLTNGQERVPRVADLSALDNPPLISVTRFDGKILLAEDNPDLRVLVSMYLRRAGVSVVTAENGSEAIERMARDHYDLVLMDIQMPGMDGLAAMRKLHQSGCKVPIVALTANAMKNDQDNYRAAGFSDFLAKPIEPEQLYRVLNKFLTRNMSTITADDAPIMSRVQDEDSAIMSVVQRFVDKLPWYYTNLTRAMDQRDWPVVREIVHDLKGSGGTMGYPLITEIATSMYLESQRENLPDMLELTAQLAHLIKQIQRGAEVQLESEAHAANNSAAT